MLVISKAYCINENLERKMEGKSVEKLQLLFFRPADQPTKQVEGFDTGASLHPSLIQ